MILFKILNVILMLKKWKKFNWSSINDCGLAWTLSLRGGQAICYGFQDCDYVNYWQPETLFPDMVFLGCKSLLTYQTWLRMAGSGL